MYKLIREPHQLKRYKVVELLSLGSAAKQHKIEWITFKSVIFYNVKLHCMQDSQSISKKFLYFMFTIQVIAWEFAIALLILLGAQGYVGFDGSVPISATCTPTYFDSKYKAIIPMIEAAFVGSIIGVVVLTSAFIVMLVWVIRVCKDGEPSTSIVRQTKISLYLLANFGILAEIAPFGYYLTHIVELNSCTATYNLTQIIVIFIIAALLLFFAFIFLLLILYVVLKDTTTSGSKYRDVTSQPTDPNQEVSADQTYHQFQRKQPYANTTPKVGKLQHTKENLMEPQPTLNQGYSRSPYIQRNSYPSSYKQTVQQNYYPSRQPLYQDSNYVSSAQKASEGDRRNRYDRKIQQDENDFQVEQNRFMKKYQGGGSILPNRGVEEKSPYSRTPSQNAVETEKQRKHRESPPSKLDQEAIILSNLRGKYGN